MSEPLLAERFAALTTTLRRQGIDAQNERWLKIASAVEAIQAVSHPDIKMSADIAFGRLLVRLEKALNAARNPSWQWQSVLDVAQDVQTLFTTLANDAFVSFARQGGTSEMTALLAQGYDIDARGSRVRNPLEACLQSINMFGTIAEHLVVIQTLLDHGATVSRDHLDSATDAAVRAMLEKAYLRQAVRTSGTRAASRVGRSPI